MNSNIVHLYMVYMYHHTIGIYTFCSSTTLTNALLNMDETILKDPRSCWSFSAASPHPVPSPSLTLW